MDADRPLFGGHLSILGVDMLFPTRLVGLTAAAGPLGEPEVERIHRRLADVLPPA